MAAPNFPIVDTSKYFCFGHMDEEREAWDEWQWYDYYEMMNDYTIDRFKEHSQFRKADKKGENFGTWTEYLDFGGRELPVTMSLYIFSGRYSGCCFDFGCMEVDGVELPTNGEIDTTDMPEVMEGLYLYEGYTFGWFKMQAKNFTRRLTEIRDKMKAEVENLFGELCEDKLQVSCRFSNGETWYERIA